ncbi:hypothetical protein B0A67_23975 [Flavobacterium aquidurense]|uniref:DUF4138 domain-containing protein n=1 Tax=Flavobacterium aquidurense TaxID=362413 RepID=UPI00091C2E9E|nr:DUF4138 domain-containing protein [Flavobacterium aquidurense]OXA65943.1 hypothetical protein B0A67_23975 [Flavobacterium aquidurense]SHH85321.1 protein of unknown function [Flavobacterium frigidimaris]
MKNNIYITLFLIFPFLINAQIKVGDKKYTTLIFESNIISGIVSNSDFDFEFNEDSPENMALLKAKTKLAEDTSLIVKTENGTVFNINLLYGANEKNILIIPDSLGVKLNYSSKNIKGKENDTLSFKSKNGDVNKNIRENDYIVGSTVINDSENTKIKCYECENLVKNNNSVKRVFDKLYNITIRFDNVYYLKNKLYFVLTFKNESALDYSINYIKSYVETGNENKASSAQYLEKNPILIYNLTRTIKGNSEKRFVFVFDQFSIDNNKKLTFEVNENGGERNLVLEIPHYFINSPKKINIK